jgi:hypothetical protein
MTQNKIIGNTIIILLFVALLYIDLDRLGLLEPDEEQVYTEQIYAEPEPVREQTTYRGMPQGDLFGDGSKTLFYIIIMIAAVHGAINIERNMLAYSRKRYRKAPYKPKKQYKSKGKYRKKVQAVADRRPALEEIDSFLLKLEGRRKAATA